VTAVQIVALLLEKECQAIERFRARALLQAKARLKPKPKGWTEPAGQALGQPFGSYQTEAQQEPFNARKWFLQDQARKRAVDLSDDIWADERKLRNAFSWLARIGAAPKFGSLPIAYYQQDQVRAIDAIKAAAQRKHIDVKWVRYAARGRYAGGRILAWDGKYWVPVAALTVGYILPI
jgi:hypothetical protein